MYFALIPSKINEYRRQWRDKVVLEGVRGTQPSSATGGLGGSPPSQNFSL